jgi:hypothetical protein
LTPEEEAEDARVDAYLDECRSMAPPAVQKVAEDIFSYPGEQLSSPSPCQKKIESFKRDIKITAKQSRSEQIPLNFHRDMHVDRIKKAKESVPLRPKFRLKTFC